MPATEVTRGGGKAVSVRLGTTGLNKSYGTVQANRNVSLAVAPQEIHAVVGENGAGKTTLMRILQGIEQPGELRGIAEHGHDDGNEGPGTVRSHRRQGISRTAARSSRRLTGSPDSRRRRLRLPPNRA